ncbi:MAG TPA: hypothetical protein VN664_04910, partial [Burkholderiales bacterium]|nr:hypothetical protein [Burkholderiales bacterium]
TAWPAATGMEADEGAVAAGDSSVAGGAGGWVAATGLPARGFSVRAVVLGFAGRALGGIMPGSKLSSADNLDTGGSSPAWTAGSTGARDDGSATGAAVGAVAVCVAGGENGLLTLSGARGTEACGGANGGHPPLR